MRIPTFIKVPAVEDNKYFTDEMIMYFDEINQFLQNNLSTDGWNFPQVTAVELAELAALTGDRAVPDGATWYVTDASPPGLVTMENGTLKRIDTSAYP